MAKIKITSDDKVYRDLYIVTEDNGDFSMEELPWSGEDGEGEGELVVTDAQKRVLQKIYDDGLTLEIDDSGVVSVVG